MAAGYPLQKKIDITDAQNGQCMLSVESVFSPGSITNQLVMHVSASNLIPASPKQEQVNTYEPYTVANRGISNAVVVSQPTLTFAPAAPGKPSFLVLKIAQWHTNTPVTITTDQPEYFQLASDNHPHFSPALTLVPSLLGTYVHLRYLTGRKGSHSGQLLFQGAFEHTPVALKGSSKGVLPVLLEEFNQTATKLWAILLTVTVAGGLGFAAYTNRSRLFFADKQPAIVNRAVTQAPEHSSAPTNAEAISIKGKDVQKHRRRINSAETAIPLPLKPSSAVEAEPTSVSENRRVADDRSKVRPSATRQTLTNQSSAITVSERVKSQAVSTPPAQESELEQVLNKKPPQ